MEIYEITGFRTGIANDGVNYLSPADSFQNVFNGFIYRQVLQSRQGIGYFAPRLEDGSRVLGIFEHIPPSPEPKELLAFDANFLYKYNTTTGNFDQIPFVGSMAGYKGFEITAKDGYISGTSYPASQQLSTGAVNPAYVNNGNRFVFTGEFIKPNAAGSAVFFYNGTDVSDFTSIVDNPNYAPPTQGQLVRAHYVTWFGERLNFVVPTIITTGTLVIAEFNQGILYSGIRTISGDGDKFNVPGSGLLQADTYENCTGCTILGQILVLNFNRSNWTLEKTRDAFNPYFIRKVPSVEGTNANFSAVSWFDIVRSIGKTGIIETDGRESERVDNKIPYFTQDTVDQLEFNLTYGGFDRVNNQFLWTYLLSGSNELTQNQLLVNNYEEETWSYFDIRLSVLGQTDLGQNIPWDGIDKTSGNSSWAEWDTTEKIWDKIGLGLSVQKTLAGDDLGFIYDINGDYDDYFTNITAIVAGVTTVLTVDASAFKAGDLVVVQTVEGMTELNNFDPNLTVIDPTYISNNVNFIPWEVLTATTTSVELNVDSTLFTAYTTGGTLSKAIDFSAELIPFNPFRAQGRLCYISHVEFLIDATGGFLKVDVYQDEEESPFKENVLLLPRTTTQRREWITMSVDNEANFMTFVLKQSSPAVPVRVTSIRIHCQAGGYTSG